VTLADFEEIVFLDSEFMANPGERPEPVCAVATEQRSRKMFRLWLDGEEDRPVEPPFAQGPRVLTVAYFASAELGCCRALGWPFPPWVLDLYVEFRAQTNGLALLHGRGLLGAMASYGLEAMEGAQKELLRKRILEGGPYDAEDQRRILDYCETDVRATEQLFSRVIRDSDNLVLPLLRGEFMKVIASAEYQGVPVDAPLYRRMRERWAELQANVIRRVHATIPVFEDGHFRTAKFRAWLASRDLLTGWPLTDTGGLALDEGTFRDQAALHDELEPLRQVRQVLGKLHQPDLSLGRDGRNRCLLSPFGTKTGRCAPSTTRFIFGAPSFLRGLIRPEPGKALAYADWSQQEFGIAAALSGDSQMQAAYRSGDPYLAFAKFAGVVPENGTKQSHPRERGLFKTTTLAVQYQMSAIGLAAKLGVTLAEAQDLLDYHHRIFAAFWRWSDAVSDYGQIFGEIVATLGWKLQLSASTSVRTLRNFPMQANGSEMLRMACVYAARAGVEIIAPVHDAVLIEADEGNIEDAVREIRRAMRRASEIVLAGFALETDALIIRHPARFSDERGAEMWGWMLDSLAALD
jgi:hypothetical protein